MRGKLVRIGLAGALVVSGIAAGVGPASADSDTASIAGTVYVGDTTTPASGVDVILVGDVNSGFFGVGPKEIADQTVGADGTFDFTGLAASDSSGYQVCYEGGTSNTPLYGSQCYNNEAWNGLLLPSGPGFVQVPGDGIQVTDGQAVTGIDGHVAPNAILTGTVTDSVTGKGIAGVNVDIVAGNGTGPNPTVQTDAKGVWVATIPGGPLKNQVCFDGSGVGYESQCYNGVAWPDGTAQPAGTPFGAVAGAVRSQLNGSLEPRIGTITGKVAAGDTGAVLPGVKVTAFTKVGRTSSTLKDTAVATTTTAGNGTYSFSLPAGPGVSYDICFATTLASEAKYTPQCYGYQTWSNQPPDSSGVVNVSLHATAVPLAIGATVSNVNGLLNPGSISGHVTSKATGDELAGVTVVLMHATTGQYVLVTKTDSSGGYSFGGLVQSSTAYYVCFNSTGLDGKSALTQYNAQCWRNAPWIGHGPVGAGSVPVVVKSGIPKTGVSVALTSTTAS